MLDFTEVGKRIEARGQCDCGQCDVPSHTDIVSPLIGQLLDPEYHGEKGTVLHTAGECINLGQLLEKQAGLLDAHEQEIAQLQQGNPMQQMMVQAHIGQLNAQIEMLKRRLARITLGTVVAALWLSSIVISVWLAH